MISIGRYCLVSEGCILRSVLFHPGTIHLHFVTFFVRPPYKTYRGNFNYYPTKIGDYVHIGANSVVEAAIIGNYVKIGKNCVIVSSALACKSPCHSDVVYVDEGQVHDDQGLRGDCRQHCSSTQHCSACPGSLFWFSRSVVCKILEQCKLCILDL